MLDLALTIVCTTSIGVIVKIAETRVRERLTMLLLNYIVATLISTALWIAPGLASQPGDALGPGLSLTIAAMILAPVGGFVFALNFFLMVLAIKKRGVALPVTLMRLSAIVPVAASLLFFGESPTWLQVLGMLGALAAAAMMSVSFRGGELVRSTDGESKMILAISSLALLFCFGLGDLTMKLFERLGNQQERPLFLAALFGSAGISVGVTMLLRRVGVKPVDAMWGILLGVPNYFSSYFLVGALRVFPSHVVFPTVTALTVMVIALIARTVFREGIGALGLAGIALTLVSIAAVNL